MWKCELCSTVEEFLPEAPLFYTANKWEGIKLCEK